MEDTANGAQNAEALPPNPVVPLPEEPSVIAQAEVPANGESGRVVVHITRKRNRTRDDLSLSPDMAKTGKRQRKSNSLFSGFSIDKKTSSVVVQEQQTEEPMEEAPVANPAPSLETEPVPLRKKEVLLSTADAQEKAKKLPKGYAYVPVTLGVNDAGVLLPAKRERKKVAHSDYLDEKQHDKPQKGKKQKGPKPKKNALSITVPNVKKQQPSAVVSSPVPDEITAQMMKKQELEQQLNQLTQQLAMVSQTLETKKKEVKTLEKMAVKAETEFGMDVSTEEPQEVAQEFILPSGTVLRGLKSSKAQKQHIPKKPKKEKLSVYDRFDSDEDADIKKAKKGPKKIKVNGDRSHRSHKRKNYDISDDEIEDLQQNAASLRKVHKTEEAAVNPQMKPCLKLLKELFKHRMAVYFREPVDPEKLGIPDYFNIIKTPMDFGTIHKKLLSNQYETVEDFGEDVRLVFANATTYNPAQTEVHGFAIGLSNLFEKRFASLGSGGSLPSTTAPITEVPPEQSAEDTKLKAELASTINELKDSVKSAREEIAKLKKQKGLAASPAAPAPRPRAPPRPREELKEMTFDEKQQLSLAINNLQPENLGKIVQIIHQRMPNLAQNSPDEIEIDIDALDTGTLRALEKYVKSCQTKQPKKKGRPPNLPKHLQAEATLQQTSKSIQDVKKKLQELTDKTSGLTRTAEKGKKKKRDQDDGEDVEIDDDTPRVSYPTVEIEKDQKDGSSSSDSDDSSSSTSDSSSSDSEEEKKEPVTRDETQGPPSAKDTAPTTSFDEKPETDQRDTILPSPERETSNLPPQMEIEPSVAPVEESPQILAPTVKKEVELKNLDSWTNLGGLEASAPSADAPIKDETWSQFQNRDLQNKQREREREEQQEREKKERAEREAERRRQEEQRQKELAEQEQKRQQEEEEAKLAAQREIEAKRAAEKAAREQVSQNSINMMDQSMLMSSFETTLDPTFDQYAVARMRESKREETPQKEEQ